MTRAMEMDEKTESCDHHGLWVLREVDHGIGVRMCEGCGQTFVLAQLEDGRFAWCKVAEHADVVDELAEALLALQAARAEQSVQSGDEPSGRPPDAVQDMREGGQRAEEATDRYGGEAGETLRELSGDAADQPVLPHGRKPRRAPAHVQGLQTPEEGL